MFFIVSAIFFIFTKIYYRIERLNLGVAEGTAVDEKIYYRIESLGQYTHYTIPEPSGRSIIELKAIITKWISVFIY